MKQPSRPVPPSRNSLQVRGEAFKALNRVRFGSPNTSVTAGANFGRVTSQENDPRQIQIGMKQRW